MVDVCNGWEEVISVHRSSTRQSGREHGETSRKG